MQIVKHNACRVQGKRLETLQIFIAYRTRILFELPTYNGANPYMVGLLRGQCMLWLVARDVFLLEHTPGAVSVHVPTCRCHIRRNTTSGRWFSHNDMYHNSNGGVYRAHCATDWLQEQNRHTLSDVEPVSVGHTLCLVLSWGWSRTSNVDNATNHGRMYTSCRIMTFTHCFLYKMIRLRGNKHGERIER